MSKKWQEFISIVGEELMATVIRYVLLVGLICYFAALVGCASSEVHRTPASYADAPSNSNAHPAAYLVDTFQVNRPLPEHKPANNAEFYFKKCSETGGHFPSSRTSYDCEYP